MKLNKLQAFYILIKIYNFLYIIFFTRRCRFFLQKIARFNIGKNSSIQAVRFFSFGKLKIGFNTIINSGCYIDNRRNISIGNNVVIAHDTKIYTLGHDINDLNFVTKGAPVIIEDYVIIFSNVLIMPGVTIKMGAVVLPGSVISKDVAEMNVVGGNPGKFIKMREKLHTSKRVVNYWFSI
ncbi:acyltransferase [Lutibacter sp.]|uniref:acyltransferase n=1 Tax=Lutibacter sp. TaxID=1925666 RepID=UPI001A2DDA18|nr:acyltransferase [Lutibacter sp.]MBI9041328.1 acyltransferase [Lutibacter sp.]